MAAYASVTSLMGTIHVISRSSLDLEEGNKEHLESVYHKAGSLLDFLDNSDDELIKDLQRKVKDLANGVEDEVESQILLVMKKDEEHVRTEANERLLQILQQAIEGIDSVKEKLKQRNKNYDLVAGNRSLGGSTSPRPRVSTLDNDMEGHNTERELMLRRLTGDSSALDVISIVGMGGIGKSTFAKRMFSDPSVVSFFDVRGWITVSKDYSLIEMLLSLLQDATGVKKEIKGGNVEVEKETAKLVDCLQKSLKGKRYLIVVDDIWSTNAWDDIRLWFPENSNSSRILLTTRDMNVAQYASYLKDPFPMRFLEPEESWKLFCQKVFGKNDCPAEFERVGKLILENCNGLPLIISVVAGALSSKRTLDEWNEVALGMSSLVNVDDYQHCLRLLSLSYNHLPSHLKACFLYFGVFTKASDISVKKLIRLWIAEGLVELRGPGDLEKVAGSLLHDLIDKNLVVVSKRSFDGKVKRCKIHDLLHDLCLKESETEKVSISESKWDVPQDDRLVSSHSTQGRLSFARSFFEKGYFRSSPFLTYNKTVRSVHFSALEPFPELKLDYFKLLRVLDLGQSRLMCFPSELSHLVSLRYLCLMICMVTQYLPVYKLLNLQTFIFPQPRNRYAIQLPSGVWKMSQLRHLHSRCIYLNSPPRISANDDTKYRVLENLQSISWLSPACCTKEIFKGIKKVKQLGISNLELKFPSEPKCLDNLKYLHELEELSIVSYSLPGNLPSLASFPPNLKKLTLCKTSLLIEDMAIINKLPKLEVLQLKADAFVGSEDPGEVIWEVTDMGFPELRFLLLEGLSLDHWRATDDSFACLESIMIRNCLRLKEIPERLADSTTLQLIELHRCGPSLVNSAEQIRKEQGDSFGNYMLKVNAFDTIREERSGDRS